MKCRLLANLWYQTGGNGSGILVPSGSYTNPITVSITSGAASLALNSSMSFGTTNLIVGTSYLFSTTIKNAGTTSWVGSLSLKQGTNVWLTNNVTIAAGGTYTFSGSCTPSIVGSNLTLGLWYQTSGSSSVSLVPAGSFVNPITINVTSTINLALNSSMSFGTTNLNTGTSYQFITNIKNNGTSPWGGSFYLKQGSTVWLSAQSVTIAAGGTYTFCGSYTPVTAGTNLAVDLWYQTGGAGSGILVPAGSYLNPITVNVAGSQISFVNLPVPFKDQRKQNCNCNTCAPGWHTGYCGHTSCEMVFSYYSHQPPTSSNIYLYNVEIEGNFDLPPIPCGTGTADPNRLVWLARHHGYEASWYGNNISLPNCAGDLSLNNLKALLSDSIPVIVQVYTRMEPSLNVTHWMVLRGIDEISNLVYVNDPGIIAGENKSYSLSSFLTCWNMSGSGEPHKSSLNNLSKGSSTTIFAASHSGQSAYEYGNLKHGAFTYCLLEGLEGAADEGENSNTDQKITINELIDYVKDRLPELIRSFGDTDQSPVSFKGSEDFVITVK